MKKFSCVILILLFSLCLTFCLTSCDALSSGGGFIGKIVGGKQGDSQADSQGNNSDSKDDSQGDNQSNNISEEIVEYVTLVYVYDNGNANGEISLQKNSSVKLPTPERLGYTFKGWNLNGKLKQGNETISVSYDTTLYATWEVDSYKITYNLNGGNLENAKTEFTINVLPLTLPLPDGETDNMSFVKWTTDQDGNNEITEILREKAYLKDYTVYAFYEDSSNSLTYKYNSELEGYEVISYNGTAKSVTIPSEYKGVSVKSIGGQAFSSCRSLTSITIPDSVTSIGSDAFYNCGSLTSITIPDSVTSIGNGAFYDCVSLTSVKIGNGVTSIGHEAFKYCNSLTSVTIGNNVTSIGDWAFEYCSSLTSITIPDSVTSIGNGAFEYCSSLTSVTISNGVTSIGSIAFDYCNSLTSITIPDSVTSIGSGAFYYCSSLTNLVIGKGVRDLSCGHGCSNLKTVYVNSESVANNTNSDLFDYAETVYVGKDINLTSSYYSVVMEKESEETVTVDGVEYFKYVLKK